MNALYVHGGVGSHIHDGDATPLHLTWSWLPSDPLVVRVTFERPGNRSATWEVGRELIDGALRDHMIHGDGDVCLVRVWPDVLVIQLTGEDGSATVTTTDRAPRALLRQVDRVSPLDADLTGFVDAAIAACFERSAS